MMFLITLTVLLAILPEHSFSKGNNLVTDNSTPCVEGKSYTLTCTLKKRMPVVQWLDEGDAKVIAYCHKNICLLNHDYEGQYNYSFDPARNIFNLTVLKIDKTYNGRKLVCSDGLSSSCKILNVLEEEQRLEETEDGIIVATSACFLDRNISFKWIKIEAYSKQEVKFKPNILERTEQSCTDECGANGWRHTEAISIVPCSNGTKYYLKMAVVYGIESVESNKTAASYNIEGQHIVETKCEKRGIGSVIAVTAIISVSVTAVVAVLVVIILKKGEKIRTCLRIEKRKDEDTVTDTKPEAKLDEGKVRNQTIKEDESHRTGMEQTFMILSPEFNDVWENSTLELTCNSPAKSNFTIWSSLNQPNIFSYLSYIKEGECTTVGSLAEKQYFETRCYSNATFKVKIKSVDVSYHGQKWICSHQFYKSNTALISVQVPIRYVRITNLSSDSLMTVEKTKVTLYCETSEGRPAANISWTRICKKDIRTTLINDEVYNVSRQESLTERNMTIVRSRIDIEPVRDDNDTRIICEATNKELNVVREDITILVQYPPGNPYFLFLGQSEHVKNGTLLKKKIVLEETSSFTILCKADGYPSPTCTWNVDRALNTPKLTFTNISKDAKGSYKCFAENIVKGNFPTNEVKTNTSLELEIEVLYQSRVVMFDVIGLEQKESINVATESETIIFNCRVDSNPESSISLSFKGKELGNKTDAKALNYTHQISSCFDDGLYKCAAQNRYNDKQSVKELRLHVRCSPRESPEFILKKTVSSTKNHTVTFRFQAIAKPMPEFEWFKLSETLWKNLSTGNKYDIHTFEFSSNLSVRSITDDDYGHYKLEIRNEVGTLQQMFFLKENEQEHVNVESSVPRIVLFVAAGSLGLSIFAAILIFFGCRYNRQKGSENKLTEEVNENPTTTINDDNNVMYEEIGNVYEHLDGQLKEGTVYMEMQNIVTDESHKDYITPII